MASAGSLIFDLAANVAGLRSDMKKAQNVMADALSGMKKAAAAIGITIGAAMAVNLGKSFASSIQAAIDQTDALGKLAERYGTTAEAMSVLQFQAKTSNVTNEALTTSIRNMSKAMIDAQNPASLQAKAIGALGLSIADLKSKDPAKALEDIAEAMSGFKDGADKVAVARAIFGKTGDELIPMLNQGRQGFSDAKAEAEALGIVVSTQTAKAAAEFTTELTKLREGGDALWRRLATDLLPTLQELVKWFVEGMKEGGQFAVVLEGISSAALVGAKGLIGLIGTINAVKEAWGGMQRMRFGKFSEEEKKAFEEQGTSAQKIQGIFQGVANQWEQLDRAARKESVTLSDNAKARLAAGNGAAQAGKKTLDLASALDKAGKAGRTAKAGVDEYAQMLKQLQEELRRTQANGDEMQLLLTDPRMANFTAAQIETLRALKQENLDLAKAQQEARQAAEDFQKREDAAGEALVTYRENLRNVADALKDTLDPSREYVRTVEELAKAHEEGFLSAQQFAAGIDLAREKMEKASTTGIDPMKKQIEELKDAMLGWGKQASDTFIDFISGAGDASKSFGEMAASILRDIAKMLVYKNFIEPLFSGLSGGGWGGFGGGSMFSNLFGRSMGGLEYGGQRAAGGAVYPGQFYRVNESPFANELFSPSTPGRIQPAHEAPVNVSITINTQTGETDTEGDSARAVELAKRMAMVARQVIATEKRSGGLLAPSS